MGFISFLRGLSPLSENDRYCLDNLRDLEEYEQIKKIVRQKKAKFVLRSLNTSFLEDDDYFALESEDSSLSDLLDKVNKRLKEIEEEKFFKKISENIYDILSSYISADLIGFDSIKKAIVLQLFATDTIHILLLGDVGIGKSTILKSAVEFAPISYFGLGSGVPEVGLGISFSGKELIKGLLPLADRGLCAIDDLNLMSRGDKTSLYNAMEKGFVTYNKAESAYKVNARVKVLATARPIGNKFERTYEKIKRQIPFDPSLLQKFHLAFVIKQPDVTSFKTKKTVNRDLKVKKEDINFIRDYINYSEKIEHIDLPREFENEITDFVEQLKKREYKYLVEVSPRFVITLIRMSKASARMELRDKIEQKDLDRAKEILKESLRV